MSRRRVSHPGRGLTAQRQRYAQLIAQGVSNSEACRILGVHRKTGTRWKYGRTILTTAGQPVHFPPVRIHVRNRRHVRYLSLEERYTIADLYREGAGVRAIAAELGRSPSTVSRELHRNRGGIGRYLPGTADRL